MYRFILLLVSSTAFSDPLTCKGTREPIGNEEFIISVGVANGTPGKGGRAELIETYKAAKKNAVNVALKQDLKDKFAACKALGGDKLERGPNEHFTTGWKQAWQEGYCWKNPNPTTWECQPIVTKNVLCCKPKAGTCGDGSIDDGEDELSCPEDFGGGVCGDGECGSYEDANSCSQDCSANPCGNSICEASESTSSCPHDCAGDDLCGNGICEDFEYFNSENFCSTDCDGTSVSCNDNGTCEFGEDNATCPNDCGNSLACGNNTCDSFEDETSCPMDCMVPEPTDPPESTAVPAP